MFQFIYIYINVYRIAAARSLLLSLQAVYNTKQLCHSVSAAIYL